MRARVDTSRTARLGRLSIERFSMRNVKRTAIMTLLLVLAVPTAALATHSESRAGGHDFAVGTGLNEIGRVSFAAHGGPSPLAPVTGHFTAKGSLAELGSMEAGAFRFLGPVTCLTVVGNRAGLFYPIENAEPSAFEGQGVFISLEDNGNPGNGGEPDRIGFVGPVPVPRDPLVCPPGPAPLGLEKGNVTVHDAP